MRGCCVSLAGLCALTLALAAPGALGGQPQPPPPPPQLVKKATWEETVKTVPDWYWRNYALGVPAVKKLREFFPEEKAKFYDLVRRAVLDGGGEDRMRFWLVGQAMSLDPQGADRAGLSLALASLQAAFLSPSLGGETLRGVDAKLLNEKDRKLLADLTARCKEWQYDILATGRSYEAERLIREAQEMAERKEFREAAVRLIKVATGHPNGYLPQENGVILGTGVYARTQLAAMAREHFREVTEAVEAQSPGLARRAEAGDRAALERLATAFPFTAQGAGALLRLGEEHLDANRPRLAALCFDRLVQGAPDGPLRAEALWRLATAWSLASESARAEQALTALAGLKDVKLRLGSRECTAAQAAELVRKEFEATPGAAGSAAPEPGATLKPRLVFSYRPALFDLRNRCSVWPRFWARPESLAAIEGDHAFFHDSANLWALDWRQGALLWHYRSPGYLYELAHRERSFSNQIDEAWQSSRGYRVGVCGERVCARFRRPGQNLWYELRGLATGLFQSTLPLAGSRQATNAAEMCSGAKAST